MRKYLTTLGILGLTLAMVGVLGSVAWAQGPPGVIAKAAELENIGGEADEANGVGLAAVASGFLLGDINIWGVEVEKLKSITTYNLENQNAPGCTGLTDDQIVTFTTGPTGAAAASDVTMNALKNFVIICRGAIAILSGELFDVNQAVRGRGRP